MRTALHATPPTLSVEGPALADPAQVGNKFARLETMRRAALPVPSFFCLTVAGFDAAMDVIRRDMPPVPTGDEALARWCKRAEEALRRTAVPPPLAVRILAAYDERIGANQLAAVRACAVPAEDGTGEDGAGDPFAGMSDSFLYVPRGQVLRRVVECWASAFTERAVRYRLWRGMDPTRARIAVGVQRMVPGARSFVAFTRDPQDGADRTVIAAAHGIGEGVVAEKADVDHFFVQDGTVRAETVFKRHMVALSPGGGGPAVVPVPRGLARPPVLLDPEALEITRLTARVERLFGGPQDVEGVITTDGALHLVQARPAVIAPPAPAGRAPDDPPRFARDPSTPRPTAEPARESGHGSAAAGKTLVLQARPEVAEPPGERRYWSNHNITESYPGVSAALTFSQAREFYRRAFGDLYHRMGVPRKRLARNRHHLEQMVAYLDGRVYYRLEAWQALHGMLPAFELVRTQWERSMGVSGEARHPRVWSRARAALALPGLLARMVPHPLDVRRFLRWWDDLYDDAGDLSDRTPEELVTFYRMMWSQVGERWGVTLVNTVYVLLFSGLTTSLARRWTGAGDGLLAGLLIGGPENRSLKAVRSAVALAESVSKTPRLEQAVLRARGADTGRLWDDITGGAYGRSVARAATEHLRRYGDRAPHDLKLEEPTPRQRPELVLDVVRPFVEQGLTVERNRAAERRAAKRAAALLKETCPNPVRRAVLRLLAAGARASVRAREDTRFCRTQLYGLSRQVMWRLGAELAASGLLDDAADVQDLTVEEVLGAFDGTLPGTDLRALATHRRAERARYAATPPPHYLLTTPTGTPLATALPRATAVPDGPTGTPPQLTTPDPGGPTPSPSPIPSPSPATGQNAAHPTAPAPDRLTTSSTGPDPGPSGPATTLRGLGSSSGVVRGRARVVADPGVDPASCRDAILIARETDPGWLYLMMIAKGLVVERGTMLSHTAITGRLLGIPTVVAVDGAATRIPDGSWIEIDGGAGTVRLLEGPPQ
ncbi:PEP/pyruvate-binding domain-containing protein [Sphaerisporangium sp. TRM90804]|uniref:PEP/pyruvate-binding domain-containing protein n=1 Tax=Sphaerisporangium sp. TRM90804 TaxID=3031113 RepID=UPI00244B4C13|nr:PEP/pyruvate-binding domain-containing protein [Sphaerisporangium sp. TRM90804]MDH2430334.1 PEP/pyruvate-binding domain-containing protein [Sphaerisporangium sp. TRM90804]